MAAAEALLQPGRPHRLVSLGVLAVALLSEFGLARGAPGNSPNGVPPTTSTPMYTHTSSRPLLGPPLAAGEGPSAAVDYEPGTMNWILAIAMSIGLVVGLTHVYRVLRGEDSMALAIRNVPEGMRPVECGACHTAQYVSTNGRIFVCCSCHSANRIPIDFPRVAETELVAAVGPLRRYEFRKSGAVWQELRQEKVDENCAGASRLPDDCAHAREPARGPPGSTGPAAGSPGGCGPDGGGATSAPPAEVEPSLVGRPFDDEVVSCTSFNDGSGLPQCVVCLDKAGCMVLLPCAHGSVCEECVTRIVQNRASGGSHCPHCRSNIQVLVKIHEVEGEFAKGLELRIPMARPL